jgi:decaprenyl-phosphate phosphoribosyltransferase
MGTLRGFPNPPALWLRRAKLGYAYAILMGTLRGFSPMGTSALHALPPHPGAPCPASSNPPAFGRGLRGTTVVSTWVRFRVHSSALHLMVAAILKSARPHQWVKNLFVAAPLVFAQRIADATALLHTSLAVAGFCMISSAVYLLNDLVDVEKDRAHPLKRLRPIAAGALSVRAARIAALVLGVGGLLLILVLGPLPAGIAAAYLVQNLAYSFYLKHVPFVDVASIATGFLLRVLAGAEAIPVEASLWLLVCTLLLASFLGFGKRAHELRTSGNRGGGQRKVLDRYNPSVLRVLIHVLAVLTILAYAVYTQSPHAYEVFGTRRLILTVPFAVFGVYRFIWLLRGKEDAESPTDSMLSDAPFMINLLGYAVAIVAIIYAGW